MIQQTRLIDILEKADQFPDAIEVKFSHEDGFKELEHISVSPLHQLEDDEVVIQRVGEPYSYWNRVTVVEWRDIPL